MKKVYVRWLGAYGGKEFSLNEKIKFEFNRRDEAACEVITKWEGDGLLPGIVRGNTIGLLLKQKSIFREFRGDVWSYYGGDTKKSNTARKDQDPNKLYARNPSAKRSVYKEAWAHMDNAIIGIVILGTACELKADKQNIIKNASMRYNVPVYRLHKGMLIEEKGGIFGK